MEDPREAQHPYDPHQDPANHSYNRELAVDWPAQLSSSGSSSYKANPIVIIPAPQQENPSDDGQYELFPR